MKELTIVFRFDGERPELAEKCLQALVKGDQGVTAASHSDEITKLEFFEHLLDQEEIDKFKKRIAELEEENNKLKMPIELGKRVIFTNEQFAAHNIKQRVAAIRDVAETFRILNGASTSDLLGYAEKLRNQARGE